LHCNLHIKTVLYRINGMGLPDEYHKTETLRALLHCWVTFGYLLVTDGRPFLPYLCALDGGLLDDMHTDTVTVIFVIL